MGLIRKFLGRENDKSVTEPVRPSPEPEPEPVHIKEISPIDLKTRLDNGDDLIVVDMSTGVRS